ADNPQFKAKIGETMRVKEEIAMATEILNTISKDEHAIAKYRARRKWEADLTTNLSVSRRLGKEEGRQEGILIGMERGMERGIQKGRQEGRQEGMEEGIERGIARGLQEGIEKAKRDLEEKLRLSGVSSEEIKKLLD
ncbi:MAG: hypothetical protein FWH05_08630, partial [Oscillospiraceae bacterium]|nr:hypothetical protein [Oscillospiraceae bacterium]